MNVFQPKLFGTLKKYNKKQLLSDVIAGIIVAIIALPLSIALAIASGVTPERGLYTAIVAGFVIAFLGGSNVNISGPTAAFATIVAGIVAKNGIAGLATATVMAGVILIVMGLLKLGGLIKFIPVTITTGFTSGIAITIAIGQIKDFLGLTYPTGTPNVETGEKFMAIVKNMTTFNYQALIVGAIGLAILILWPKISKKIPASLIAVIVGSAIVKIFGMNVNTIGDLYQISPSLPTPTLPDFSFETIKNLVPDAFTVAVLAAIESLLSCVVSDGMINDRHNSNTELIALGTGNIFSALFGGIPATGAIARTAANVKNGGRSPISGMVHAIVLLLILVVLMPYASLIPMPIIAAILFMVAYNMSEWRKFISICKTAPKGEILVLVLTFGLTVCFNLVVAICAGIVLTSLLFLKQMSDNSNVREWTRVDEDKPTPVNQKEFPEKVTVYEIEGAMFFAVADSLTALSVKNGDKVLLLRMSKVMTLDITAAIQLEKIAKSCKQKKITLLFSHVNKQPLEVLMKNGFAEKYGDDIFCETIDIALEKAQNIVENATK